MQFRHRNGTHAQESNVNQSGEIALVNLAEGTKAILAHTAGGICVVRRLSEMGLTPGSEIKLLRKCSFHGPIEIEVRGVSLAIGYGLASQIYVHPLKASSNA